MCMYVYFSNIYEFNPYVTLSVSPGRVINRRNKWTQRGEIMGSECMQ